MVKEKVNSIRTYDDDGYRRRAACLCFKDETEKEILLVTSSKHKDRWIVPGGGIEPREEPDLAAVRECKEEAGVHGQLLRKLGVFESTHFNEDKNVEKKHRTNLYAFIVTELLDEWEDGKMMERKRMWFNLKEARELLAHKPVQVTYLDRIACNINGVVK
ncbi:diphosphoinositol polyphosphate phosphohydrolase 1-like isoform X1 [Dreissena polymorpha]|uniref:diphosphoinositol polyphosphate phosphohydrolase 1-like isoform X1 n=1 Tax=Dreissena polymorpha TaxID=45954 RepID=UPI0022643FBA|nr:diphosphoinositol polyphosphate phosphohydrolase 1-like isoform X1 [Dreissena polymorpha]